jgi:hypothetical protein
MAVPGLKVGPEDTKTITRIAESLRRRSGQSTPYYSTRQIIDACYPGTLVTGRRLPASCHELTVVDEHAFRSHHAPHAIVYRRDLPIPDQRLAIAHGLAHVIFDGPHGFDCADRNHPREVRCDRFAAELLVPLIDLPEFVSVGPSKNPDENETYLDQVDQIASHFHVTSRLIDQRIRELRR